MTKQVHRFGRNSLDNARQYVNNHPGRHLIILKDVRGHLAVCRPHIALELKTKGFQPIDSEE